MIYSALFYLICFFIPISLMSQNEDFTCKVRLPGIVNSYAKTLLPVLTPDGSRIYFDRKEHPENIGGINDPDDIWYCDRLPNGYWTEPKNIGPPLNSMSSNALFAINPKGNKAFVASVMPDYSMQFSIAEKDKKGWKTGKIMKIENFYSNSTNYFATMNADANVLLFSLTRNETLGDLDLYASFLLSDTLWTEPLWLGSTINTAFREGSPFLANDGKTLYFFSNGHQGYGGNDLFVSRRLDDSWTHWSKPVNLGPAINTPGNERSITLTSKGDTACIISTDQDHESEGIYFVCLKKEYRPEKPQTTTVPNITMSNLEQSLDVYFPMGSSTLTQEHKKQLGALCGLIKDKSRHAIIEGFTDDIGGVIYNQRLSEKRASSITQYLKQCGLESEDSIGKGVFPIDRIQSDISKQNKRKLSRKVTIRLIIKV